jgi:hypothetical protein
MGWHYSNGGGSNYAWSGLNTYNQHAALITGLTSGTAVIKLFVKAAGYNTGTVSTRLVAWSPTGATVITQSSTFSMADGNESTQYSYEKSVSSHIMSGTSLMVGLYRSPSESHIMETDTGSGDGYRKTNTASFPSVSSMSGYNTDSNDEPYVGVFMIAAPSAPNSLSVSRNSDTSQTIQWNRTASSDAPYYNQYLERWDNVSNTWYVKYTLTTDYTSTGTNSYTDTTTVANRQYRYRVRAWNDAGYSSYSSTAYIHTTPAVPTNVVATRVGSNVEVEWEDNSYGEDLFRIQRRESTDEGDTWGSWSDLTTETTSATSTTDTSPYTYGQYRVQAEEGTYNSPTLLSGYTESNEVVTLSTPDAPTGLSPDGGYVFDADEYQLFTWNHNPTDQTSQTKFSLNYKISGGSYPSPDVYDEWDNTDEEQGIPGSVFSNGNDYFWKCKTWGEYATESDYSAEATFKCVSRPVGTLTQPTAVSNYSYSELEVEWTYTQSESEDQKEYLCKLYNDSDLLLESKQLSQAVVTGGTGSCTFNLNLENDTNYKVTLQVQEDNGLWSAETDVEFTTEFLEPLQPTFTLSLNEESGSIDATIVNSEVITEYENLASQDTFVYNYTGYEDTNYDDEGYLSLYYGASSDYQSICLDFDLSFFIGKTIVSAQLNLFRTTAFSGDMQSQVQYIDDTWDETTTTFNNISSKINGTAYGYHSHSAGDTESWDITSLVKDIADEVITDYEGLYILPSGTGYPTDVFYDNTIANNEPELLIEIEPENAETDHNILYRSVNGGDWEIVETDIPINTTVTDHIPSIGGNNNYYVQAVSTTPSTKNSEESDIDVELTGMFFINGGNGFEDYVRLVGDILIGENINRNETIKQFAGRTYPVKYQGNSKIQNISFSADCPITKYDDLVEILESVGDIFYRDWRGRWFYALLSNSKLDIKDPQAYQFSTNITRLQYNDS